MLVAFMIVYFSYRCESQLKIIECGLNRVIIATIFFATLSSIGKAQLPQCGWVYTSHGGSASSDPSLIYNYNPSQAMSLSNPNLNTIVIPPYGYGLAVSDNLNGQGPSPTFYTEVGGYYYYYDGISWTSTGHTSGDIGATGLGAGGGYIYSFNNLSGQVYKYDGTSNAMLIAVVGNDLVGDIAADCAGNFYISTGGAIKKYTSGGVFLQSWIVTGFGLGYGAFTLVGDTLFGVYSKGVLNTSSTTISLTPTGITPQGSSITPFGLYWNPGDMASCPGGDKQGYIDANIDTGYYCGSGSGVAVNVNTINGPVSVNWSLLDGQGVIVGLGFSRSITSEGISHILLSSTCYSSDTVTIAGPAKVDAGIDKVIDGCNGLFKDTLSGQISDTIQGVIYNYSWLPTGDIASGGHTLHPVIIPTSNVVYTLIVTTSALNGGCIWQDSISTSLADSSIKADFSDSLIYGCSGFDTITFKNLSTNAFQYRWDFGDGLLDTTANPIHSFSYKDHNVLLTASNTVCADSILKSVDSKTPIDSFDLGADMTICTDEKVELTLRPKILNNAIANWSDGSSLPYLNIVDTGIYWVTVTNTPCSLSDTIRISSELCNCQVSIPTAFSPNSDGLNDFFRPVVESGCLIRGYILSVYNRWGQRVYIGNNIRSGWDGSFLGEPLDLGIYMYTIQFEAGTQSKIYHYKGDFALIR